MKEYNNICKDGVSEFITQKIAEETGKDMSSMRFLSTFARVGKLLSTIDLDIAVAWTMLK